MNVYDQIRQASERLVDGIFDAMRSLPLDRLLDEAGVKKPTVARPRKVRAEAVERTKRLPKIAPPPFATTGPEEVERAVAEQTEKKQGWVLRQREGMPFTVRFTHNGKRIEKSTGTKDRAQAEDMARTISLGYQQ